MKSKVWLARAPSERSIWESRKVPPNESLSNASWRRTDPVKRLIISSQKQSYWPRLSMKMLLPWRNASKLTMNLSWSWSTQVQIYPNYWRRRKSYLRIRFDFLGDRFSQLCFICIKIEFFIEISNLRIFFCRMIKLKSAILDLPKKCQRRLTFWCPLRALPSILLLKFCKAWNILIRWIYGHWELFFMSWPQAERLSMLPPFNNFSRRFCMRPLSFHRECPYTWEN